MKSAYDSTNICVTEHNILTTLENLKLTKYPGPDTLHPRILYEIRYEILQLLKILFETSYNTCWHVETEPRTNLVL